MGSAAVHASACAGASVAGCCWCMDGSRPNLSAPRLGVQCWSYNPRDRPDFTTIAQQLG